MSSLRSMTPIGQCPNVQSFSGVAEVLRLVCIRAYDRCGCLFNQSRGFKSTFSKKFCKSTIVGTKIEHL
jgi:hypothetical protein